MIRYIRSGACEDRLNDVLEYLYKNKSASNYELFSKLDIKDQFILRLSLDKGRKSKLIDKKVDSKNETRYYLTEEGKFYIEQRL